MADGALGKVEPAGAVLAGVGGERAGPGNVVGVYVDNPRFGINRGAAPFGSAIESGKDDGVFAYAERHELAFAAEFAELLERPAVDFWRAVREHVFGEQLPRKGHRLGRQRLLGGGDFARDV